MCGMKGGFEDSSKKIWEIETWGSKTAYFRVVLRRHISANNFGTKQALDKQQKRILNYEAFLSLSQTW